VLQRVDAHRPEGVEVQFHVVIGARLHDDLELVVVLQAVGILAVPPVRRAAGRLHVGGVPRLGTEGPQERRGIERSGADLDVVRLVDHATFIGPELLQGQNEILKKHRSLPVKVIGIVTIRRERLSSQIIEILRGYNSRASLSVQAPQSFADAILDISTDNRS
jgi:hypothetical protein